MALFGGKKSFVKDANKIVSVAEPTIDYAAGHIQSKTSPQRDKSIEQQAGQKQHTAAGQNSEVTSAAVTSRWRHDDVADTHDDVTVMWQTLTHPAEVMRPQLFSGLARVLA